ncbi:SusC/RagA family TonB-linked outer membrane protein [Flavisolibacter tropicus]|uniref:SusC/RagA family TonB-linked outer membrane protein n=1 Tax=Flavisolibacter tropicus TaxID=1492898 RepID=UPI000902077B|nr:SusC/RagA family TonB-linked outer membrane protein [Flavisolibacter tropicus]
MIHHVKGRHLWSVKNRRWLFTLLLPSVFSLTCINALGNAGIRGIPFQDTIPATRITGKVLNAEDGVPLAGASVENQRTKRGTVSNAAGLFSIEGRRGDNLIFSFTGRGTQTIAYTGQSSLDVALNKVDGELGEVVVTGFQRLDKKKFTGSAATLKMDDIKVTGVTDVNRLLEGRAAGVSVQNVSGTFGAAPKVRVRGATSINGDNKPLWVVDGVVLEDIVNISNDQLSSGDPTTLLGSSVAGINSNDIETIDILKDAAATALYGARAMNGVVVITTKKGRSGKPTVAYTANFSTQLKPVYTDYNIMNSAQQMSVLGELERKGFLNSDVLNRADYGVYGQMFNNLNALGANGQFLLQNTPEARKAFLLRYANANTDWFDILFQNSLTQEHSLSISGGTDKSQSFFSTSFYYDNGWTIADNVKRYTLNFRNNYSFNDKLSTGFLAVGSVRQQRAPGTLNRNSNPVSGQFDRDFDINPFSYALNTNRAMTAYDENGNLEYFRRNFAPFNIINELANNYIDLSVMDLKLQGELGYKFNKHLRYEFIGALRYVKSSREHQITENSNMANAYRANENATVNKANKFLYQDPDHPDDPKVVVLPYGGFYNRAEDQMKNFDVRNSLNYNQTFNSVHEVSALLGQQIKYTDRQNFENTGYGYQYENGGIPFVDYRILKQAIESNFPYYGMSNYYDRFAAFYLNAQYTFDKKYNLYGTVRYDGSNRLGASRSARWLPTWSFGGAWNVEREHFMENVRVFDYLKLRASYGITANLGPATNSAVVLRSGITNRPYADERESIISLVNLENADLTWEKNYQANVGVDFGLFKNRLTASVDAYSRRSFDLISRVKTSGVGGEAYKAANYADMKSQGFEFLLSGQILKQQNFDWKSTLTFGYNETQITNAQNVPLIWDLVKPEGGNRQGYPVNSLFSIKFKGLNPSTGIPEFIDETGKVSQSVYLQDDKIDHLVYEGPVDPIITGGFSNTFSYKTLSLNAFLTYQAGNKIRLYPAFRSAYVDLDAMSKEFYDRWEMIGDEQITNVPAISDGLYTYLTSGAYPYNNYNYSTARVADGGFVRVKTISLTYQMGKKMLDRLSFLKNCSITAALNNFWLLYSDEALKGQDPEFFNAGGVAQPIQKQAALSIKLGL